MSEDFIEALSRVLTSVALSFSEWTVRRAHRRTVREAKRTVRRIRKETGKSPDPLTVGLALGGLGFTQEEIMEVIHA